LAKLADQTAAEAAKSYSETTDSKESNTVKESELTEKEKESLGDDCEDDDEFSDFPVPKGSSRLIANLERFYAKGYVEGYDFDDDWIDDSNFSGAYEPTSNEEVVHTGSTDTSSHLKPEFDNFYVHQGEIKLIPKPYNEKKPPKKKRKLVHNSK